MAYATTDEQRLHGDIPLAVEKMAYATTDEQRLHGDIHSDETWERATADQEWWRAQSLSFPAPPIKGTGFLVPVSSFDDLLNVHQEMGIPLDNFWVRSVLSPTWGTAYFFKWHGQVPALVNAVFGDHELKHVDCLAKGDRPVPMPHRFQILASVIRAFAEADFEVKRAERVVRKASLN
jgi:hypothetical protein